MSTVDSTAGSKLWGGKVVVMSGDFRQVLPVVKRGTRPQIVNAAVNSSETIWHDQQHHRCLRLSINMRVQRMMQSNPQNAQRCQWFGEWVLTVGRGTATHPGDPAGTLRIPPEMCAPATHTIMDLCATIFGDVQADPSARDPQHLLSRGILTPKNEDVNTINELMHGRWPGKAMLMCT
jgi:ATP-dependent DNA helicase PIF1